jgi:type II secretory pathway component PulJ
MGASTILDIVGSIIIGGMMLGIILKLNNSASLNVYMNSGELACQQNLVITAQVLETDFRRIGYCSNYLTIQDPTKAILSADTASIKFTADIDQNGIIDTVNYYLGPATDLNATANPRDKILYRVINGVVPTGSDAGITRFYMVYFKVNGDTIPTPVSSTDLQSISDIELNMNIENPSIDSTQIYSYWRQERLAIPNIKNR